MKFASTYHAWVTPRASLTDAVFVFMPEPQNQALPSCLWTNLKLILSTALRTRLRQFDASIDANSS